MNTFEEIAKFDKQGQQNDIFDKLDQVFKLQATLDSDIEVRRNLNYTREEWVQKEVLALISELGEVLDEVNFKWWKNPQEINDSKLHEEIADVFHFFISLCIRAGLDADMLFSVYCMKNEENFKRQHGTSSKKGYEVV